jgi:hypothetical protein
MVAEFLRLVVAFLTSRMLHLSLPVSGLAHLTLFCACSRGTRSEHCSEFSVASHRQLVWDLTSFCCFAQP